MPDWQTLSLEGVPLFFFTYNYVRDVIYKKALLLEITHSPLLLSLPTDRPSTCRQCLEICPPLLLLRSYRCATRMIREKNRLAHTISVVQGQHTGSDASLPPKRRHICATCERGFTTSGHLARHTRIHTGERNHKCPFPGCETRCSRQDNLQQQSVFSFLRVYTKLNLAV